MREIKEKTLTCERALFGQDGVRVVNCVFDMGESPLKESRNIVLTGSMFRYKYPLWYTKNIRAENCAWTEMARAGVWYAENVTICDTVIQAPKNFRRCKNLTLENVSLTHAAETLWSCCGVKLKNITAKGDYFAMNSSDLSVENLNLDGNYSFDGCKNVTVKNCRLLTKDAFWNCENVIVYDSFISGEYLGWNSKNLTFVNCTIESLQGMCYIDNLKMIDCKLINTTLAFEYSSVEANIQSDIKSVFNPASGRIEAEHIGRLIIEKDKVDPNLTLIVCGDIRKKCDRPAWKEFPHG